MLLQVGHSSIAIAMTLLALSVELLGDVWKENMLLAVNSTTRVNMYLPQIEYISGILIPRRAFLWNYLVFFFVKLRNMFKVIGSKTWSVDTANDTYRASKWNNCLKIFLYT
jgi:hypothetical protein